MIVLYAAMFLTGILTKFTDNLKDSNKKTRLSLATGTAYGITAAIIITASRELAVLITATTAAMLATGKIDARPHQIAAAIILAAAALTLTPTTMAPLLASLAALSVLDEISNDWADKAKGKGRQTIPQKILGKRLMLEAGTLAIGILTANYAYFIGILSFDVAYNLTEKAMKKR